MTERDQSPVLLALSEPQLQQDTSANEGSDIYRGRTPSPTRPLSPDGGVSARSSFSDFTAGRGRLGALAAVVDRAITRWARRNTSDSSSSSSESSGSSAVTRSRVRLRRRRPSVVTLHTVRSERNIAARIKWIQAREEKRQIPREFTLYLPPSFSAGRSPHEPMMRRITRTTSLSLVLAQLDSTLKPTPRHRRAQEQNRGFKGRPHGASHSHAIFDGKLRDSSRRGVRERPVFIDSAPRKPKAWFLDVASPTWEDLRALGKSLHLHPLTLDDILQHDPREKLEHFPKLGYYFISFRAIERAKEVQEKNNVVNALDHSRHDDGFIAAANVYLVVFKEGICSFHFTDISEHTDRVRNRIVLLEEAINMSSDWIAHGILDSIVDSFFPLLKEIEKEVIAIDDLVFLDSDQVLPMQVENRDETAHSAMSDKVDTAQHFQLSGEAAMQTDPIGFRFSSPRLTVSMLKRTAYSIWKSIASPSTGSQPAANHFTLRRIARTRKLVTVLTRLLAPKSEVIAQIRKRLLTPSRSGLGNGIIRDEDVEVSIYLGDVQDHILTLQHALAHYERMLGQSHPAYLSQLRTTVGLAKNGADKALIYLTCVTVAVLCAQTVIGTLSMNVTVPHSPTSFHVFGFVISFLTLVLSGYVCVVRWWWIQAKRSRRPVL